VCVREWCVCGESDWSVCLCGVYLCVREWRVCECGVCWCVCVRVWCVYAVWVWPCVCVCGVLVCVRACVVCVHAVWVCPCVCVVCVYEWVFVFVGVSDYGCGCLVVVGCVGVLCVCKGVWYVWRVFVWCVRGACVLCMDCV